MNQREEYNKSVADWRMTGRARARAKHDRGDIYPFVKLAYLYRSTVCSKVIAKQYSRLEAIDCYLYSKWKRDGRFIPPVSESKTWWKR